jgi:NitT/TauT family transport system substrate-binding protein
MNKLITLCLSVALVAAPIFAENQTASKAAENPATLKVAAIVGTSGIGMAYLFANPPAVGTGTAVSFETVGSADVLLPKLLSGEVDICVLPPNVAAKLYNVGKKSIVAGAVVGNGMLSLVTRDPAIKTLKDLEGKTVSVAGQGATPEYVFRALIAKTGLPANSVTPDFSIPNPEIAAALVSNRISCALVPEPFATVAIINGGTGTAPVRRAISIKDEWKAAGFGQDFPMTLCVIRKEYADKNPETVRKFLQAYKDSIAWTVANPAEAGKLVESSGLGLKAPVAAKSIPSGNYTFIPAVEARDSIEKLLSVFLYYAPEAVGGKLPDDGFYFK